MDAADRPDLRRRRHRIPGRPGPGAQDRRPGAEARTTARSRRRRGQPHRASGQPRHHRACGGLRCLERVHHHRRRHRSRGGTVGLEPWQTRTLSKPGRTPLNITAVPARHGPVGTEDITGPVTGFLLHTDDGSAPSVYVSGDTVDLDAMSVLADRYRVDVALLHLGAAGFEAFGDVRLSLTAVQAVEARRLLGDPLVVAVHAEGWAHYTEDRGHVQQVFDAAGVPLHWPAPGEPLALPDPRTP
ncbi:MBL fold metallo-hydrolase [Streptomyces sp. LBUM 1476]|nr:MBL fold metallo-hydrolase [Streptomyces sp. LBUM 1476]